MTRSATDVSHTARDHFIRQYIKFCALFAGAFLVSAQMRVSFSPGAPLGPTYQAQPPQVFLLIAAVTAMALGLYWLGQWASAWLSAKWASLLYLAYLATAGLVVVAFLLVLPDLSQLQIVYFAVVSLILGYFFIAFPGWLANRVRRTDVVDDLRLLWSYRALILLWARYNVISRYSQAVLGVLWIVLLPLFNALIFAFVFSKILHVAAPQGVPFVVFLLAGLAHWNLFSQGMLTGTTAIMTGMPIISQVYFPREILVIVKLVENVVDYVFVFGCLLIINAISGLWPSLHFLALPFLLMLQLAVTLGVVLITSNLSVFVRDIPQLVPVVVQLLFYVTPVLYPITAFPASVRFFVALNPLASIINAYREIIVFSRPPNLSDLYLPMVLGVTVLYVGYKTFKANELRFADFV